MNVRTTHKILKSYSNGFAQTVYELEDGSAIRVAYSQKELEIETTPLSINHRAFKWLLGSDTGISSETLCAHMLGIEKTGPFGRQAPSDAADRARCIRLLKLIPEWVPRLDELKALDTGKISVNGAPAIPLSQHYQSWTQQLPYIRQEGNL